MSKQKVFILADSPEEFHQCVARCVEEQKDFLDTNCPVWCSGGELSIQEAKENKIAMIDGRKSSVLCQEYGIEFDII
jgi:hypothetical protein